MPGKHAPHPRQPLNRLERGAIALEANAWVGPRGDPRERREIVEEDNANAWARREAPRKKAAAQLPGGRRKTRRIRGGSQRKSRKNRA